MNPPGPPRRLGTLATTGSVVSAIASSACCWLPLLLITFGASAVGVASFFEKYRPVFLVLAAGLLGAGFYFNYFRKEQCAPGSACAAPRPRLQRFNRITLWIATALVVAFSFFPSYVGLVVGGTLPEVVQPGSGDLLTLDLEIGGMTCEGCASTLTKALLAVPGVLSAKVSYEEASAAVTIGEPAAVDTTALKVAVEKGGYSILSMERREGP